MNFCSKRGFVLVDALLGMALLVGVGVFCCYARQFIACFVATSADVRKLVALYRQSSPANHNETEVVKILLFQQECCIASYDDEIIVIQDKRWKRWPLLKNKGVNNEIEQLEATYNSVDNNI